MRSFHLCVLAAMVMSASPPANALVHEEQAAIHRLSDTNSDRDSAFARVLREDLKNRGEGQFNLGAVSARTDGSYSGTATWRKDMIGQGGGRLASAGVRIDLAIPDGKMSVSMFIWKVTDLQFPASHVLEIHFKPVADYKFDPVIQIGMPEMRLNDDSPAGDALIGTPVVVTDNYFMVGLSLGNAEGANKQLLQRRFMMIPFKLHSGKTGNLAIVIGSESRDILDQVL